MKKRFNIKKTSSIYWKNKANDFHSAVLVLSEAIENNNSPLIKSMLGKGFNLKISLSHIFAYIAAISIELNLKACLIETTFKEHLKKTCEQNKNIIVTEDDINFDLALTKEFCMHDLNKLAKRLNITFKKNQINFLKLLTDTIYWKSRYPIPRSEKQYEEYAEFVRNNLFLPLPKGTKLRARKFNPKMIVNLVNYLEVWEIINQYYKKISWVNSG